MASGPIERSGAVVLSLQQSLWPSLERTASNLANSQTVGFKRFLTQTESVSLSKQTHINPIAYTQARSSVDFSQGTLSSTENTFDLAISGQGFFPFLTKSQEVVYSRDGRLTLNPEGQVVNHLGDCLLAAGKPLTLPKNTMDFVVTQDGTVSVGQKTIGKIDLIHFADSSELSFTGEGYYRSFQEGEKVHTPQIVQGYTESANVNPIQESIHLIEIARLFENAQKILEEEAKRQSQVINLSSTSHG